MRHRHTVVWLDHYDAIVMHVHPDSAESVRISSDREPGDRQLHRKSGAPGNGHRGDDVEFFAAVADVLEESECILLTGPGNAKASFTGYLQRRHAALARRIVATETLDHPSGGELKNYAQTYFRRLQSLGSI